MYQFSTNHNIGTLVTHIGEDNNSQYAHVSPIYQTSTFNFPDVATGAGIVARTQLGYYYTRLGELKLEMLAEAAKDARSRAENILGSAGKTTLGKLVYADMGIININAANSTNTSTEGNNDTTSRDKDIITIVHAEYEVN